MDKSVLERKLDEAIQSFSNEIHLQYPEGSKEPVTSGDINEIGRQVSYLLNDFKNIIAEYVK